MGRKPKAPPVTIVVTRRDAYLEVVAEADAVTGQLLHSLVDAIGTAVDETPNQFVQVLLEVIAPASDLSLIEGFEAWRRASQRGIQRTQIAYVITGRQIGPLAKFMETVAINRGILLRFFEHRSSALEWLRPASANASDRTA